MLSTASTSPSCWVLQRFQRYALWWQLLKCGDPDPAYTSARSMLGLHRIRSDPCRTVTPVQVTPSAFVSVWTSSQQNRRMRGQPQPREERQQERQSGREELKENLTHFLSLLSSILHTSLQPDQWYSGFWDKSLYYSSRVLQRFWMKSNT